MSQALAMFNSVGGAHLSQIVCTMAPYFSTISPELTTLQPGRAEAVIPFRKEITNHLGTVHAIALCNAAEFVGGLMTDASIPSGARWIPKDMTVAYLAKAKGEVRAVADGSRIDWSTSGDKDVDVTVTDPDRQVVFTARITMNVKLAD